VLGTVSSQLGGSELFVAVDTEGNRIVAAGESSGVTEVPAIRAAGARIFGSTQANGPWTELPAAPYQDPVPPADEIVVMGSAVSARHIVVEACGTNSCPRTTYFRRLDAKSGAWGAEVAAPICEWPTLIDLPPGDAILLCWKGANTTTHTYSVARYDAATSSWDAPTSLVSNAPGKLQFSYVDAARSQTGAIALLYKMHATIVSGSGSITGSNSRLYAVQYDPTSSAWGTPVEIAMKSHDGSSGYWIESDGAIRWDAAGDATAIWRVVKATSTFQGLPYSLEAARYSAATQVWSAPQEVAGSGPALSGAFVGLENRVTVFSRLLGSGGQTAPISMNVFDPALGSWAGEQAVEPSVATGVAETSTALDGSDNAFVAWTAPTTGELLASHRAGPMGTWAPAVPFPAEAFPPHRIAALGDCKALLAWIDAGTVSTSELE
jgi:hypothetical protein